MKLSGHAAIVTGGASGMGEETARALVAAGARVTTGAMLCWGWVGSFLWQPTSSQRQDRMAVACGRLVMGSSRGLLVGLFVSRRMLL